MIRHYSNFLKTKELSAFNANMNSKHKAETKYHSMEITVNEY